ncbi:hypothetical protein QJS04_geneDACA021293 [Acorus gramineus]|uniref:Uncharacterized protein n=1 Tax=Acorus gramineus TaxID=55184 RepID=A0AAV9ALM6_ACOGR|nr:hypothetical protein QJS04_geneDACA021293 [Acorus gramineus]
MRSDSHHSISAARSHGLSSPTSPIFRGSTSPRILWKVPSLAPFGPRNHSWISISLQIHSAGPSVPNRPQISDLSISPTTGSFTVTLLTM